ncbi:hypothetical protein RCL1_005129 [Eukaryota sp. TZLM3-RCL]
MAIHITINSFLDNLDPGHYLERPTSRGEITNLLKQLVAEDLKNLWSVDGQIFGSDENPPKADREDVSDYIISFRTKSIVRMSQSMSTSLSALGQKLQQVLAGLTPNHAITPYQNYMSLESTEYKIARALCADPNLVNRFAHSLSLLQEGSLDYLVPISNCIYEINRFDILERDVARLKEDVSTLKEDVSFLKEGITRILQQLSNNS